MYAHTYVPGNTNTYILLNFRFITGGVSNSGMRDEVVREIL